MLKQSINKCIKLVAAKDELSEFLLHYDIAKYQAWSQTSTLIENEVDNLLNQLLLINDDNAIEKEIYNLINITDDNDTYLSRYEILVKLCIRIKPNVELFSSILRSLIEIFETKNSNIDFELSLYLICEILESLPKNFNNNDLISHVLALTPSTDSERKDFWHHKTLALGILSEHVSDSVRTILMKNLKSDDKRLVKEIKDLINMQY